MRLTLTAIALSLSCLLSLADGATARTTQPIVVVESEGFPNLANVVADDAAVTVQYRMGDSYWERTSTDLGRTFAPRTDVTTELEARYLDPFVKEVVEGDRIYQLWQDQGQDLQFRTSPDGGESWSQPREVAVNLGFFNAVLAAHGDNAAIVYSEGQDPNDVDYFIGSNDAGQTWSGPLPLGDQGLFGAEVLSSGDTVAMTLDAPGANFFSFPGSDFTQPPRQFSISSTEHMTDVYSTTIFYDPLIANAGDGAAMLWEWENPDGDRAIVLAATGDAGETWHSQRLNVEDLANMSGLAAGEEDRWFATWTVRLTNSTNDMLYLGGTPDAGLTLSTPRLIDSAPPNQDMSSVLVVSDNIAYLGETRGAPGTLVEVSLVTVIDGEELAKKVLDNTRYYGYGLGFARQCPGGRVCAGPDADASERLYVTWHASPQIPTTSFDLLFVAAWLTGDADCDGDADLEDFGLMIEAEAELATAACKTGADLNCDDAVDMRDAALLGASLVGVEYQRAADCPPAGR